MAGLSVGSIPQFYRDVYSAMCHGSATKVCKEVWMSCLKTASLPESVLEQIWVSCDSTHSGDITRDGLYRSLALTAIAQQGRPIEEKSLQHYEDNELPSPTLASLSELKVICTKFYRSTLPTELGYSYDELKTMDDISISLLPEKKGTVFKHNEYLVESKNLKSQVRRRFKDFEAYHELLLSRYPYRLVPCLPPKKLPMSQSGAFIEQRRRSLKRFLLLIVRHPILSRDEITKFFFTTTSGQELGSRMKDKFKNNKDEFCFNDTAKRSEELLSAEARVKYDRVKEQVSAMHAIMASMLQVAENMETRSVNHSRDMKALSTNLQSLATDTVLASSWTSGSDDSWSYLKRDSRVLAEHLSTVSQRARDQAVRETSGFTERVHLFLDLIVSYEDLCSRREETVRRHQKALTKVHTAVSHKERMQSQGHHVPSKEDSRILRRDNELIEIEKRNFFSLLCLDLEAQLIHVNLAQLPEIFHNLVTTQVKGHTQYQAAWTAMQGVVDTMHASVSGQTSLLTPTQSPTSSLLPHAYTDTPSSPFV
jgi:sorting nexin-8